MRCRLKIFLMSIISLWDTYIQFVIKTHYSTEKEFGFQLKQKNQNFSINKRKLNITIIPSFNPYFYATEKDIIKNHSCVDKIKDSTMAKILTLDENNWK